MLIPRSVFCLSKLCNGVSSRYALGSVLFERIDNDWCRAVVTDGRCLVVVEWKENHAFDGGFGDFPLDGKPGFAVLIPAVSCNALYRLGKPRLKEMAPPKCGIVALEEQSQEGTYEFRACVLTDDGGRVGYTAVTGEGRFPKWQDVICQYRKSRSGIAIGATSLDAELFSRVLSVVNEVSRDDTGTACAIFMPPSNGDPVIIAKQCDNGQRVHAMIMPKVHESVSGEAVPTTESQLWWPDEIKEAAPVAPEPATIVGQWREVVSSASEAIFQADTMEPPDAGLSCQQEEVR